MSSNRIRNPYKYCPRCGEYKLLSTFAKNAARSDGLQVWCTQCRTEASQKKKRKKATLKEQGRRRAAMSGEEFHEFYRDSGWLYRYIGSAAAMKTRDMELRKDLRQEAWIRLSFCPTDMGDDAYKKVVDRAIHQAYTKQWRSNHYDLDILELMTRDEYAMWMTGVYLP